MSAADVPDFGRVALRSPLHWRRWGDEWVVFSAGSGQTHKLDALSAAVLLICEEGARPFSGLVGAVATQLEVPADRVLQLRMAGIVEQCVGLELLESDRR
jgi:PqqD family protein of HPr-rel-A system